MAANDDEEELDGILADYLAAEDTGAAPRPADLLAAHPRFAAPLREFLESQIDFKVLATGYGHGAAGRPTLRRGETFAGCEILGVAGVGGSAVVYRALQAGPTRVVALKVLARDPRPSETAALRFRYEAEAVGRLAHVHVATVFSSGVEAGRPYLIMEYLGGGSWRDRLAGAPAGPAEAAAVVRDLSRGVAHAHAAGVIHRDIKPANVLFDAGGRAKLADFGCAAVEGRPAGLTRTGEAVGTPQYMAPEQATAAAGRVTVATDVHGLGAVLFAALTGRPPFPGDDLFAVLRAVVNDVPPRADLLNAAVPADLAAVAGKCLEKHPARRYRSANELADDLDRYLEGEPVHARPAGPLRRLGAWARRRPARAAALAVALAAATLLAGGGAAWGRAERQTAIAVEAAGADRFFAGLERVRGRRLDPRAGWAAESLAEIAALATDRRATAHLPALRSEAAMALGGLDLVRLPDLASGFPGYAVAAHPTEPVVVVTERGTSALGRHLRARVYDRGDGGFVRELRAPTDRAWQLKTGKADHLQAAAFSPDGRWFAAGLRSGTVHVWRWADAEPVATFGVHPTGVEGLAFDGSGTLLFVAADRQTRALRRGDAWALLPGVSPGGDRLPHEVRAVDEAAPDPLKALDRAYPLMQGSVCRYTADGTALYGSLPDGVAVLRTPGDWSICGYADPAIEPKSSACRERWSPDGRLLVESDEHGRAACLRDMTSFRPAVAPVPTAGGSGYPAFDAAGRTVYLAGPDAVARYAVAGLDVQDRVGWAPVPAYAFAVAPDGRTLATVGNRPDSLPLNVFGRDAAAAPPRPARPGLPGLPTAHLTVTDGGEALASTGYGPSRGLARSGDDLPPADRLGVGDDLEDIRADAAGRVWVSAATEVRVHALPDLRRLATWRNDPAARAAGVTIQALAPGRGGCLLGRRDGRVFALDAAAAELASAKVFGEPVTAIARQAAEGVGVAGSLTGELVRVEVPTLAVAWRVPKAHAAAVTGVGVADSGLVASGSADRTVRLWTPAGEPILTLRFHAAVRNVVLTADGRDLFVLVAGDRAVRRWRLDRLADGLRGVGLDPGFHALAVADEVQP